eukprot:928466-Rhodomonas_salina.1
MRARPEAACSSGEHCDSTSVVSTSAPRPACPRPDVTVGKLFQDEDAYAEKGGGGGGGGWEKGI